MIQNDQTTSQSSMYYFICAGSGRKYKGGYTSMFMLGKVNHCPVLCLHFDLLSCVYSVYKGQTSKFTTSSLPRC